MNRGLLNWGVFFILLGAIPLAVRQGLLTEEAVARAWTLWPLLLIAAGIGLLLRRTRLEFAGGLITAATLGIIGGGVLASGGIPFGSCGDERGTTPFPAGSGELGANGTVEVQMNCGDLTIATTLGAGWRIEGVDEDGTGPEIEAEPGRVEIRDERHVPFDFGGSRSRWEVGLGTGSIIDLDATVNAGELRMTLGDGQLGSLALTVNAGQATVDLGDVAAIGELQLHLNAGETRLALPGLELRGTIDANAGSVTLCPPPGVGLRIRTNGNITASNNFAERGLVESSENVWETTDFASAAIPIELEANVNAGSIELQAEGSCGA